MKLFRITIFVIAVIFEGAAHCEQLDVVSLPSIWTNTASQTNIGMLLIKGDEKTRTNFIRIVTTAPQKFNPTVFYALSRTLMDFNRTDEAMFWFCAAHLRASYDANRSLDLSSRGGVSRLDASFGLPIYKLLAADPEKFRALLQRVIDWDTSTPFEYDHRWINLHGLELKFYEMNGKQGPPPKTTAPASQWPDILQETRTKFINSYVSEIVTLQTKP